MRSLAKRQKAFNVFITLAFRNREKILNYAE